MSARDEGAELAAVVAERGALPMPVAPEPQAADSSSLAGYKAAYRDAVATVARQAQKIAELERIANAERAHVEGLLRERHVTNEALDDAVQALGAKQSAQLTVFRASHESIVMGHYDSRKAAMDHVHATLANEEGGDVTARVIWRADDPEAEEPVWECWLFDSDMADDSPTRYVVTPLEVASEYDAEADE